MTTEDWKRLCIIVCAIVQDNRGRHHSLRSGLLDFAFFVCGDSLCRDESTWCNRAVKNKKNKGKYRTQKNTGQLQKYRNLQDLQDRWEHCITLFLACRINLQLQAVVHDEAWLADRYAVCKIPVWQWFVSLFHYRHASMRLTHSVPGLKFWKSSSTKHE